MNKLVEFLEKHLLPIAEKFAANRYLSAISNGFAALMPVIMVGSIFTLLAYLQIDAYQAVISAIHLDEIFAFAPTVTTDMLSLYASYTIANELANNLGIGDHAKSCGTLSLMSFLILIPLGVTGTAESGEVVSVSSALSTTYLGSGGLFTAMICGLTVPTIFKWFVDRNITIKMPDQVPQSISKAFAGMLPGFAIAFIFSLVRFAFSFTSYGDFNTCIYTLIQSPLMDLGANPVTYCVLCLICSLMWFFGIHGGLIVKPVLTAIYYPLSLENLAAYAEGAEMTNLIVKSMWATVSSLGGVGGTIGLCIYLAFFAKSKRYRQLGRMALPAGLCDINEPITFGLPLVMNPVTFIPQVITPIVCFLICYACELVGLVPAFNGTDISVGTPIILSGLLAQGWQLAVLQVVLVGVQFLIWAPFARVMDNKAVAEEQAQEQAEAEGAAASA